MYAIHLITLQALDEARSIARRPMAQSLKDEREEIVVRCHLAKGDADRAVAETAGHANPGKSSLRFVPSQFRHDATWCEFARFMCVSVGVSDGLRL